MSNEDSAPSPADGPAKVFGRELVHRRDEGVDWWGIRFGAIDVTWQPRIGFDIRLDHQRDTVGGVELLLTTNLSALLSLIPAEQVVGAMVEETREAIGVLLMPWCMSEITKTRGQRDEALARAESLERQIKHLVRCEREANERGDAEKSRAEQAERERDAMHAAAEELRARGADCVFCKGTGRSCGNGRCDYQWCASCKACNGTGRKTEESDGKQGGSLDVLAGSVGHQVRPEEQGSQSSDVQPVGGDVPAVPADSPVPQKPEGVPASATIWAEVVDGLGRKVGAWFVPPFMKGDLGHVDMYDPEQPGHPWAWSPGCDSQWKGSFDERLTPSAAAQCRQLYEKGLAHLAAEATPKPTLTPVDLTELREAWNDYMPGLTPLPERIRPIILAVESLLSGGAP